MFSRSKSVFFRHLRKRKVYYVFAAYFIVFGMAVALLTSAVNYQFQRSNIDSILHNEFKETVENKLQVVRITRESLDASLYALAISPFTHNYLDKDTPDNQSNLLQMFSALLMSEPEYLQVRFLDTFGQEKLRVNRISTDKAQIVAPDDLQDKSDRYYFTEAIAVPENEFWYSRLDLNIENGEIVKPIVPTIRAATPVYHHGRLRGLIIINVDVSAILHQFSASSDFTIFIQDKDKEILHHPDPELAWSRYLDENADAARAYINSLDNTYFTRPLEDVITNSEGLELAVVPRTALLESLARDNQTTALVIAAIVLVISFPLSWLVALFPARLQEALTRALGALDRSNTLLDRHVMISETDTSGTITKVSRKMVEVTGYDKQDLIGKNHNIMQHPETTSELHRELWDTILAGDTWKGEIKDTKKSGNPFWIRSIITPIFDDNDAPLGYTQIAQDITDRKTLEHLSQTDPLTQCYNRRKLDEILQKELRRFERYAQPFSVVMLDLDKFKSINDNWGHQAGDDTLVAVSALLKDLTREIDAVGRWGGEEFLIVSPNTTIEGAAALAEKLRQAIQELELNYDFWVTSSFGVSTIRPDEAVNRMLARADDALYRAKEAGRNRVITIE